MATPIEPDGPIKPPVIVPDGPIVPPATEQEPGILRQMAQPFIDIGKGAMAANRAATNVITHPVDTAKNIGPVSRQVMRGVNSNIPFANAAVEAAGGPPSESPEDTASAPGFQELGNIGGMPLGSAGVGIAAKGVSAAGRAIAGASSLAKVAAKGAVKAALPHSAVLSAVKGGIKAIQEAKAAAPVAKAAAEVAPVAEAAIPITKPPALAPLVAATPAGQMHATLAKALESATPEQAVTIKSAMAGLEVKAAKQAGGLGRMESKANEFDHGYPGDPEPVPLSAAERTKGAAELRSAHGGDIPGVTDKNFGPGKTTTSEEGTVVAKPESKPKTRKSKPKDDAREMTVPKGVIVGVHPEQPGWSKNGPSGKLEKIIGATKDWQPSAKDASFAKGLGLTLEKYREMMVRVSARR